MSRVRILLGDDHTVVRQGLRKILEDQEGWEVVGEAPDGRESVRLALALQPDVAVLDIVMPLLSGIEATRQILRRLPDTGVLILSMHDNTEYVLESLRAGAHGYLLKGTAATELCDAIRAVRRGESFFSPPIAGRLSAVVRGDAAEPPAGALGALTPRERQVLVGVARGHTNREIALQLGISHRTVETHRESLMRKLGVRTVAGLTRLALEAGLVGR